MNVAILGAGAMGSVFGALLEQGGHAVTLIDVSQPVVDAIRSKGLKVSRKSGESRSYRLKAVTRADDVEGQLDLVVVFVKCYHTEAAIASIAPRLGPNSLVLSLQNGWGNGPRIAGVVGADRVILGVCYHSATVLEPGHVLHAGEGATFIGPYAGVAPERVEAVAQVLRQAGIPADASKPVLPEIWRKLALNVATLPTASLLRLTADRLMATAEMQDLMRRLLDEVAAVAVAQKIPLDAKERWDSTSQLLGRLAPGSKGSMVQDVERGRRTEIDVMCGAVVDAGARFGIATPYNHAMLCLIRCLEATFAG